MITIPFTGQAGNQFFCYCMGKIIALRTGQDFVPEVPYWKKKDGTRVRYSGLPFIAQPKPTMGRVVAGPTQFLRSLQWVDLDSIQNDRPVHVESYCQRYEMMKPYKEQIRHDWLKIEPWAFNGADTKRVYVHVRRTDYVGENLNPDQQCIAHTIPEYLRCLEEFPQGVPVSILTDDWSDPFIGKLIFAIKEAGRDAMVSPGSWDRDFIKMLCARYLLISQSTFAWWAGWLGLAEKIVCPISPGSLWGRGRGLIGPPKAGDYPNLEVTCEPGRWIWVET